MEAELTDQHAVGSAIDHIREGAVHTHIAVTNDIEADLKGWLFAQIQHTVDSNSIIGKAKAALKFAANQKGIAGTQQEEFIEARIKQIPDLLKDLAEMERYANAASAPGMQKLSTHLSGSQIGALVATTAANELAAANWTAENLHGHYGSVADLAMRGTLDLLNLWTTYSAAKAIYAKAQAEQFTILAAEFAATAALYSALNWWHQDGLFAEADNPVLATNQP